MMRDRFRLMGCRTDTASIMKRVKDLLGTRNYTVDRIDIGNGRLEARKMSTIALVLGLGRSFRALTVRCDQSGATILELEWRGIFRGCAISFIELSLLTLMFGRDLGAYGILLSVLVGSIAAASNLSLYIVQRAMLRRAIRVTLRSA